MLFRDGGQKILFFTVAHGLYALLAGGFEVALVLRLTGSFETLVWFNLLFYVWLYLAFVVGTFGLRSGRASRSFRWDLGLMAAGCFYLVFLAPHLAHPAVLAGFYLFKGAGEGLFWSTRHSALIHSVPDAGRDRWVLGLQTLTILLGVVLPAVSGFVISELAPATGPGGLPPGYLPVWVLTGTLLALAALVAPPLHLPVQTVSLGRALRLARVPGQGPWLVYLAGGTCVSLTVGLSVGILNFAILGTEFRLGLFASWIALASAGFFFGVRRLIARWNLPRPRLVAAGAAGEFTSRLLFALAPSVPALVAKSLLDSFLVPLRSLFGENILRRKIELLTEAEGLSVAEGILFQETVLLVARVVGCLVLIACLQASSGDAVAMARTFLGGLLVWSVADVVLLRALDRRPLGRR